MNHPMIAPYINWPSIVKDAGIKHASFEYTQAIHDAFMAAYYAALAAQGEKK
jgi:hypothetical protein